MAQYLIAKARNRSTGVTVQEQDLSGGRFELRQRAVAELNAEQLAKKMTGRTGQIWTGFVEVYTVNT
jgi:hypothetical protein